MIYLDTSVALAHLLAEDRFPDAALWRESLVASRLLEYECWTRLHARKLGSSHGDRLRELLARVAFLELTPIVLARATEPFPVAVRTLDALHLSSLLFLRERGVGLALATYDERLRGAARRLGVEIASL
ncbi:MAG: PIN domain-containing protein [Thermodesulfobacteriota bacterium]